jgi:hypothetical protein
MHLTSNLQEGNKEDNHEFNYDGSSSESWPPLPSLRTDQSDQLSASIQGAQLRSTPGQGWGIVGRSCWFSAWRLCARNQEPQASLFGNGVRPAPWRLQASTAHQNRSSQVFHIETFLSPLRDSDMMNQKTSLAATILARRFRLCCWTAPTAARPHWCRCGVSG